MRDSGGHKAGCRGPIQIGMAWVAEYAQAVRSGLGKIASCRIKLVRVVFDLVLGERWRGSLVLSLTLI